MTDAREGRISHIERGGNAEADILAKSGAELCRCPSNVVSMTEGMLHVSRLLLQFISRAEGHYVQEGRWDNVGAQGLTEISLEGGSDFEEALEEAMRRQEEGGDE
eukprot:563948-Pyramimonas_sp.AAC.1